MRIIFMGTPEFAVPSLKALVENGKKVVAVITATDKKGGRGGKQLITSPIKKYAVEQKIPVLQPKNLKNPEFISELAAYKADLQIVVAFRMLPEVVWNMPPKGTVNLHGSLLPKYRGAAPINWAVINGEKETGVTTFKLKHAIDTGDIILQKKLPIGAQETAGQVHDKMMHLGAEAILETIDMIEIGNVVFQQQDETEVSKAPKIFHEDCQIDFDKNGEQIINFIRGLSPYPGTFTYLHDTELKIFKGEHEKFYHEFQCGKVYSDDKTYLKITCNDGAISVLELKLAGKKKMDVRSFLNGYAIR
jgi:methionyl-tRNA formyltransferase